MSSITRNNLVKKLARGRGRAPDKTKSAGGAGEIAYFFKLQNLFFNEREGKGERECEVRGGGAGMRAKRAKQRIETPPSTLSNLPFWAGIQLSRDSTLAFNDGTKIRGNRALRTVYSSWGGCIVTGDLGRILRSSTRGFILRVPLSTHRKRRIVGVISRNDVVWLTGIAARLTPRFTQSLGPVLKTRLIFFSFLNSHRKKA